MKRYLLIAVLVFVEAFLLFCIFGGGFYDDWELARAIAAWHKHPSPEAKALLETAELHFRQKQILLDAALLGLIGLNTLALFKVAKRTPARREQEHTGRRQQS